MTGQFRTEATIRRAVLIFVPLALIAGSVLYNLYAQPLPVVILASLKEERDLVEGHRLGCNSYVCKPVSFDAFIGASRQLGL